MPNSAGSQAPTRTTTEERRGVISPLLLAVTCHVEGWALGGVERHSLSSRWISFFSCSTHFQRLQSSDEVTMHTARMTRMAATLTPPRPGGCWPSPSS